LLLQSKHKLLEAYGRGVGYALWHKSECESENPQGCEKNGLLYYPKCKEGFYAFGCCVCSPDCVDGMTDIGVSCQKQSYGRGTGSPMICGNGKEEDAALCYDECKPGYDGVGPVCCGTCPNGMYQCGALCLPAESDCTVDMLTIGLEALELIGQIMSENENDGGETDIDETVNELANNLDSPICNH